jgi:hypothetical protein
MHSADNRSVVGNTGIVYQKHPINQIGTLRVHLNSGASSTPTVFGQLSGTLIFPRRSSGMIYLNTNDSKLWLGSKNKFGYPVSPVTFMHGGNTAGADVVFIAGDATNGFFQNSVTAICRVLDGGGAMGRNTVNNPAVWRANFAQAYTRNWFRQSSTNVKGLGLYSGIDLGNDALVPSTGASYQINAPNSAGDFAIPVDTQAITRGVAINPTSSFYPNQPIQILGFNEIMPEASGGNSGIFTLLAQNVNYTGRGVNSSFSRLQFHNATATTHDMESAITADVMVIEENGNPIPGATVQIINALGTTVTDTTSDFRGRIATQILVSHLWRRQNDGGGLKIFRKDASPPAGITAVVYEPFLLLVTADGFDTHISIHHVDPFEPTNKISDRVILAPPAHEESWT